MKTNLRLICFLVAGLWIAGEASAGQSAALRCATHTCEKQELIVTITTDSKNEEGTLGGYGIIAIPKIPNATMPTSSEVAFWTEADGWSKYGYNELLKPTSDLKKLKTTQEFTVLRKDEFCKFSANRGFNLYAWRSSFRPDELSKLKSFFGKFEIEGEHRLNFLNSTLLYKAHAENKVGKVYSFDCPATTAPN